jgi:hypothetical protein
MLTQNVRELLQPYTTFIHQGVWIEGTVGSGKILKIFILNYYIKELYQYLSVYKTTPGPTGPFTKSFHARI